MSEDGFRNVTLRRRRGLGTPLLNTTSSSTNNNDDDDEDILFDDILSPPKVTGRSGAMSAGIHRSSSLPIGIGLNFSLNASPSFDETSHKNAAILLSQSVASRSSRKKSRGRCTPSNTTNSYLLSRSVSAFEVISPSFDISLDTEETNTSASAATDLASSDETASISITSSPSSFHHDVMIGTPEKNHRGGNTLTTATAPTIHNTNNANDVDDSCMINVGLDHEKNITVSRRKRLNSSIDNIQVVDDANNNNNEDESREATDEATDSRTSQNAKDDEKEGQGDNNIKENHILNSPDPSSPSSSSSSTHHSPLHESNIPSVQLLGYLISELSKSTKSSVGLLFGSQKTCDVVVPNAWSQQMKSEFLQWCMDIKGFSLRNAGGGSYFLSTSRIRGQEILSSLKEVSVNKVVKFNKNNDERSCSSSAGNSMMKSSSFQTNIADTTTTTTPTFDNSDPVQKKAEGEQNSSSFETKKKRKSKSKVAKNIPSFFHVTSRSTIKSSTCKKSSTTTREIESSTKKSSSTFSSSYHNKIRVSSPEDTDCVEMELLIENLTHMSLDSSSILPHKEGDASPASTNANNAILNQSSCTVQSSDTHHTYDQDSQHTNNEHNISFLSSHQNNNNTSMNSTTSRFLIKPNLSLTPRNNCSFQLQTRGVGRDSSMMSEGTMLQYPVDPCTSDVALSSSDLGFDCEADSFRIDDEEQEKSFASLFIGDDGKNKSLCDSSNTKSTNNNNNNSKICDEELIERKRRQKSFAKHKRISFCALSFIGDECFMSMNSNATVGTAVADGLHLSTHDNTGVSASASSRDNLFYLSPQDKEELKKRCLMDQQILCRIFSFLNKTHLLRDASLVCTNWILSATYAHANMVTMSIDPVCVISDSSTDLFNMMEEEDQNMDDTNNKISSSSSNNSSSMHISMENFNKLYPTGAFLSNGSFKDVYKVFNSTVKEEEALSVMDIDFIRSNGNAHVLKAELSISILLSSLVRRNICPNFVSIHGVFTSNQRPSQSKKSWDHGIKYNDEEMLQSQHSIDDHYVTVANSSSSEDTTVDLNALPVELNNNKTYQYIRMELCKYGDLEELLKKQPDKTLDSNEARIILFQMAFALHAASDRFGLKHYDVKLLNFFLQSVKGTEGEEDEESVSSSEKKKEMSVLPTHTTLRYGIGSHVFNLRMRTNRACIVKLADYGTAEILSDSDGSPVTLAQFTTLENTPPEYLLEGDSAKQGHRHDCFGLGLCMIHLFTGHAPYEEILEDVVCPPNLKKKLRKIWVEDNSSSGFSEFEVVKSVILSDMYEDEEGNIVGEPDEILYDTLYRYLVLFGIPSYLSTSSTQGKASKKVSRAIKLCLEGDRSSLKMNNTNNSSMKSSSSGNLYDKNQYEKDLNEFSLLYGKDYRISAAREKLKNIPGGMELLFSLVSFDPNKRSSPLDVINSEFMQPLRAFSNTTNNNNNNNAYDNDDLVYSYMAFSTK